MRSKELQPTKENLLNSLKSNTISRNEDLQRFVSLCSRFEDATSIALDAKWGAGKTFFVKQAKMIIDACNPQSEELSESEKRSVFSAPKLSEQLLPMDQPMVAVYYDAWENDNDSDPVLSLIHCILQNVASDYSFKSFSGVGEALSVIVDQFTNLKISKVVEALKSEDPFTELKKRDDIREKINEFIKTLYQEKGNRLVIFIDELDRCKPSYAVLLLERIKHYFSDENVTFVFSLNLSELVHTIKQYYGFEFDATRYLDRFFNLTITLPEANLNSYFASIDYVYNDSRIFTISANTFIKHYHLSLREIERYLRMLELVIDDPDRSHQIGTESLGYQCAISLFVPILVGLKMIDHNLYEEFLEGGNSKPLIELVQASDDLIGFCGNVLTAQDDSTRRNAFSNGLGQSAIDLLNEMYHAVFNVKESDYRGRAVGRCHFSISTKNRIIRIIGMLSPYAAF